jgi:hypothetical protein
MTCAPIINGFVCDFTEYRNFVCLESATYLFEFSWRFGPAWFTVPGDEWIDVEPGGHLGVLWDMFEEWLNDVFGTSLEEI